MKNYLIAGGTSGIGLELTNSLSAHQVIVFSRNRRDLPSGTVHHSIDFSAEVIDFPTIEGAIDGLVYCPGSIRLKPFKLIKDADFLDDWSLNFLGAVKFIRHYLPNLMQSQNASIVLFSTVAVQTGMPFHASIAAAKGAVEALTKSLAAELAPHVRVNCIAPSLTASPLSSALINTEQKLQSGKDRHPLKKIGSAAELASMAAYLLSDNAAFITGQVIAVDGGMSTVRLL